MVASTKPNKLRGMIWNKHKSFYRGNPLP